MFSTNLVKALIQNNVEPARWAEVSGSPEPIVELVFLCSMHVCTCTHALTKINKIWPSEKKKIKAD